MHLLKSLSKNKRKNSSPFRHLVFPLSFGLLISQSVLTYAHPALVISHISEFETQTNHDASDPDDIEIIEALIAAYEPTGTANLAHNETLSNTLPMAEPIVQNLEDRPNIDPEAIKVGDVWDRIRSGFNMPDVKHPDVRKFERMYSKNPDLLSDMIHRSEKYLFHITNEIEQHNLPTELALLPLVESRYDPSAQSGSRAAGLWQIMPATGKHLGLKQDWWIDERKDIKASTDAALNYLDGFYSQFGEWDLALAAYNAGAGTVNRAIKKNKKANKPTDYLHLTLPKETKDYIPKLQAIKNIVANPEQYGVAIKPVDDQPYFTSVKPPKQIDTKLITELAEISEEELNALNPQLKRPVVTKDKVKSVQLPVEAADRFYANLSVFDKPLVSWQAFTLPAGERLSRIAKNFDISAEKLGKINQLSTHQRLQKPVTILVPNPEAQAARDQSNPALEVFTEENVTAQQQAHNLSKHHIQSLSQNTKLTIEKKKQAQRTYLVKSGDTLSGIAERFSVSWKKLQRLNHLKNRLLKVGQRIRLY